MQINIAERLKPFSHTPGAACILPGSTYQLQIFPALIRVITEAGLLAEVPVPAKGPLREFTVQLDLEKCCVNVWGRGQKEYFYYTLIAQKKQIALKVQKGLSTWSPKQFLQPEKTVIFPALTDRLSLGNHKSQDWDLVKRRMDLTEILPAWIKLGQLVEAPENVSFDGIGALLKACQEVSTADIYQRLQNLFLAGFSGILNPRLQDDDYQGFEIPTISGKSSPLFLLTEGAKIIRSLFVEISQNTIFLLPKLPSEFHCGRFLNVRCGAWGLLDLEWTKKMMRRMIFRAEQDQSINFQFPKEIVRFRLNGVCRNVGEPVSVQKGQVYHFDNFQK
jgi:hypothetical protein